MIVPLEKPGTPEELVHFGVKGMKWGVRKEEETSDRKLSKETQAKVNEHSKLLVDKFESPDHKLTQEQKKKIAYTLAGTVAVAAVVGGAYYLNKQRSINPAATIQRQITPLERHRLMLHNKYLESVSHISGQNPITELSYKRPAFTVPSGTVFHRLSNAKETKFSTVTYASTSEADFNRYMAYFGNRLPYHIKFTSSKALNVPDLNTVLNTLQEATGSTREEAINTYGNLSGRKWDTPEASQLFKALKRKGFGAIVDENDAGFLSSRPLVIFNNIGMGRKKSEYMTWDMIESYIMAAKDFSDRK